MAGVFDGMEYVYAVYKEKSFTRAAAKLYISQPSLSASVKHVEERLGSPVFDRSTKPLTLTECGVKYIESVERILQIENEFTNYMNDLNQLATGHLSIGGSSLYASWILPHFMDRFATLYPQIRIDLFEDNTGKLFNMVQQDQVDIIVDNYPLDPAVFSSIPCREERIYLAVPERFSSNRDLAPYRIYISDIRRGADNLREIPPVPMSSFAHDPFVLMKPFNHTRSVSDRVLRAARLHPKVLFEIDQQVTSYNITCSGLGISFISDTLIRCVPPSPGVIFYNLDPACNSRTLCFYWKAGRYVTKAMQCFLEMAKESLDTLLPIPS